MVWLEARCNCQRLKQNYGWSSVSAHRPWKTGSTYGSQTCAHPWTRNTHPTGTLVHVLTERHNYVHTAESQKPKAEMIRIPTNSGMGKLQHSHKWAQGSNGNEAQPLNRDDHKLHVEEIKPQTGRYILHDTTDRKLKDRQNRGSLVVP